jgi:glycosyltransferase involved in cell wall biosynthesis
MKVTVALEHRFSRTPDGSVWTRTFFGPSFWDRYLEVFDRIEIIARVREVKTPESGWQRVDSKSVLVIAIPHCIGPWQFLTRFGKIRRAAKRSVVNSEAVILRVSSAVAACLEPTLRRTGHPYGLEVVADPYDALAPGAVKHALRPLLRWWFPRQLRHLCSHAAAVSYVTKAALQRRYPPSSKAYITNYSSVELREGAFSREPRSYEPNAASFRLIFVGTLEELYKAPDILIESVAACIHDGLDITLNVIGEGRRRTALEALTVAFNIANRVRFLGELSSGAAVRSELDNADLFVLPSRQEGLPRAMIEAMARALPCVGSSVGGIPELLGPEEIVPPGDPVALTRKIHQVLGDPGRMTRLSVQNLARAQEYREELLESKRQRFYREVQSRTAAWLSSAAMRRSMAAKATVD